MPDDLTKRRSADQADVLTPQGRGFGLGFELIAVLMQVNLLHPETECLAPGAKSLHPHPQHLLIEIAGYLNIYHRKYNVINPLNHETPLVSVLI
jgi:hypothetical protein